MLATILSLIDVYLISGRLLLGSAGWQSLAADGRLTLVDWLSAPGGAGSQVDETLIRG